MLHGERPRPSWFPVTRLAPVAGLAGILAIGAWLRLWHLAAGLPYTVGVDEPEIMARVVRMMRTGDFNPHFFDWPSLTFYLHLAVACAAFLAGAMRGAWNSLSAAGAPEFYIYGRTLTAVLGTATIAILWAAARRWGAGVALVAAAFLAVVPNHVRESHYVLTDVPTAFFVTLALLLALRALERPSRAAFAAAGLVVGLAAACKYNGLVAIVLPLVAAAGAGGGFGLAAERAAIACAAAAAGFLAGTPYAVLDLPKFLTDYARLAAIFAHPRPGEAGWLLYLKYLRQAMGWGGMVLAGAGAALSAWEALRGPGRARNLCLIVFPLVYFRAMAGAFQVYGRYVLPLMPFVALLAARGASAIWERAAPRLPARWRVPVAATAVAALLVQPVMRSVEFDRQIGQPSTIDAAYRWMDAHLPAKASIVSETHPLLLTSSRFRFRNVPPGLGRSCEEYVASGVGYALVSSVGMDPAFRDPAAHAEARDNYASLLRQSREIARFQPGDGVTGPTLVLLQLPEPAPPTAR